MNKSGRLIESWLLREILCGFIVLVFISSLPLILSVWAFLLVLRLALTIVKGILKPDYGRFLSGANNVFTSDSPYKENPQMIVTGSLILQGRMTHSDLIEKIEDAYSKNSNLFPELKQYLTVLWSFSVWKNEKDFRFKDHLKMLELEEFEIEIENQGGNRPSVHPSKHRQFTFTGETLTKLSYRLSRLPFREKTSPWEILIRPNINYISDDESEKNGQNSSDGDHQSHSQTLIIVRIHHTLGDALSILNLGSKFVGLDGVEEVVAKFVKSEEAKRGNDKKVDKTKILSFFRISSFREFFELITLPLLAIYEYHRILLNIWDNNQWHHSGVWPPKFPTDFDFSSLKTMRTVDIKQSRRIHGNVGFFTIILAALTVGIRKYMHRYGQSRIPELMHILSAIPVPNRNTNSLSNELAGTGYALPIGLNSRSETIRFLEDARKNGGTARKASILMFLAGMKFLGLFPKRLVNFPWIFTTGYVTNMPLYDREATFLGLPLVTFRATSTMRATTSFYVFTTGYNGNFDVVLGVSKDIMSPEQAKYLQECITTEFKILAIPGAEDVPIVF